MHDMVFKILFLFFVLCNDFVSINSSRILMVYNHYGKSHYIQGKALGQGLARAGHDVTMVSPYHNAKELVTGYQEIVLDGMIKQLGIETNLLKMPKRHQLVLPFHMNHVTKIWTQMTLNHTNFQALLKSDQKFDVIIIGHIFNEALRALSWYYQAPMILFNPIAPMTSISELSGTPAPPSYIPNMWSEYSHHMNFWQRSINSLVILSEKLLYHSVIYSTHQEIIDTYFPGCPDLESLNKNISLYLINDHESINSPIPHVPSVIDILGFHVKTENHLPEYLQKYMDEAEDGVIFFSFGTFVDPSVMSEDIKKSFLKSLGKLKQKVLWKTDEDNVPGKPENIMLSKWLPQEDILAHPNCKLFITHSGFTSTIETMYHAVPVLAIPLHIDQGKNAARLVELDVGIRISYDDITEEKLDYLFKELLSNNRYRQNAKKISQLIRDRPIKPMELAIYWIEFVIRHRDISHMRVAGLDLNWYQYLLLDVILVWSSVVGAIIFSTYLILMSILAICIKKNKHFKVD